MNKVSEYLDICLTGTDADVLNTELKRKVTAEELVKALLLVARSGETIGGI